MDFTSHLERWGLAPELLLPEQWSQGTFDASRRPEKSLMLAVLEEAIATLGNNAAGTTRRARRLVRDVEEWCGSNDTDWPFSFLNICQHLGFDPAFMRAGLAEWQKAQALQQGVSRRLRLNRRRATGLRTKVSGRAA